MEPNASQRQHQQEREQAQEIELVAQHSAQARAGREVRSVEELLRFDASRVTPPASILERLRISLGPPRSPAARWLQRWRLWRKNPD